MGAGVESRNSARSLSSSSLVGGGRYGSLTEETDGKYDLMVYFELEALGHFGGNDGLDEYAKRRTVDGVGCHLPLDELDVVRQVREVLEVSARDVDTLSSAFGQGNIRGSNNGDSALDEPFVAVVHVRNVLFDGVGHDPFGALN